MKDYSLQQQQQGSARTNLRKTVVGEIVEVQGGHIVRSTGLKDRHSKVCTAKGPRDRRVRLSANTAIQFYDVQDRLGYDRPSKAVDWLIKKAKSSIDELQQLPAWSPSSMNVWTSTRRRRGKSSGGDLVGELQDEKGGGNCEGMYAGEEHQLYNDGSNSSSSLLPPSLDSDAIADTIKSFFPMGGGNAGPVTTGSASESPMHFQDYQQGGVLRRGGGGGGGVDSGYGDSSFRKSQDLKLSLQSFQDPILMNHSHSHHHGGRAAHDEQQLSLIPGAVPIGFENLSTGWADSEYQPSLELGQLHRLVVGWNTQHSGTKHQEVGANSGNNSDGGFVFNQPSPQLQPLFGGGQHSQYFTQRGPLQSSNTPSIRAWINDPSFSIASPSEHHSQYHPQALSGLGFTSGGFSGFHIPARIQGEEDHDGDLNRPSSASSDSHH